MFTEPDALGHLVDVFGLKARGTRLGFSEINLV
jgi:hypothetical protein